MTNSEFAVEYSRIRVESNGGVAWVTLDRAEKLNALDPQMLDELLSVLGTLRQRVDLSVLVLTGQGRYFSAGVDVNSAFFMENIEDTSIFSGMRLLNEQHELIKALWELPAITIAAVQGDAVGGGGFGMAMACDLRYAVRHARFWMVPGELNVVQDFGLSWMLQRAIGPARTLEMALTGRIVTGEEGLTYGLVQGCEPDADSLWECVRPLAESIGRNSPDTNKMLKYVIRHGGTSSLNDQLPLEAIANGLAFQSKEFNQAKEAFLRRQRKE